MLWATQHSEPFGMPKTDFSLLPELSGLVQRATWELSLAWAVSQAHQGNVGD